MRRFPENVVGWAQLRAWLSTIGIERTRDQIVLEVLESGIHLDADLKARRPNWSSADLRGLVRVATKTEPDVWVARYEATNRLVGMDRERRGRHNQHRGQRPARSYSRTWAAPEPFPVFFAATPNFLQPFYGCVWEPVRSDSGYMWHSQDPRKVIEWPSALWKRGAWIVYHGIRRVLIARDWSCTPRVASRRLIMVTVEDDRGYEDWLRVPGSWFGLSESVTTPAVAWMGSPVWLKRRLHDEIQANHPEAKWWVSVDRIAILSQQDVQGEIDRLDAKVMGEPWLPPEQATAQESAAAALPAEEPSE